MILLNILFLFIQPDTSKVDVIFVGGLEKVISYKEQVRSFKSGFGNDCNVLQFRHKSNTYKILKAIKENPNASIVMFSAGCNKAKVLLLNSCVNKKITYLVEPYSPNKGLTDVLVKTKFPAVNVIVGPTPERGSRIISNGNKLNAKSHLESLKLAGIIVRGRAWDR